MPDTPRDWNRDRELCDKATPGPWERFDTATLSGVASGNLPTDQKWIDATRKTAKRICYTNRGVPWSLADLAFIAEARTGWPAALQEIARLESLVRTLSEALEFYADRQNWHEMVETPTGLVPCPYIGGPACDDGARARAALAAVPEHLRKDVTP